MMRNLILFTLLLPLLVACSNIRSKQPVGKEPIDLSTQANGVAWQNIVGHWLNAEGETTQITIVNANKGVLHCQSEDEEVQPVTIRQVGGAYFLNVRNEEGEYHWMQFEVNDEMTELILWEPDRAKFRKLIVEKKIKGTNDPLEKRDEQGQPTAWIAPGALIDDPSGAWIHAMLTGEHGVLVDWKKPMVLRKKAKK